MRTLILSALLILFLSFSLTAQNDLIISKSTRNDISGNLQSISNNPESLSRNFSSGDYDFSISRSIEQLSQGTGDPAKLLSSFDGLGYGFKGPQGEASYRNPSDNSLAVGLNHIVQTVNSRMAIFTKKGDIYDSSGMVLYGPVETRNVFRGFGGPCEQINNGDAVVQYDQLADRWLIVMPIFRRLPPREIEPEAGKDGEPARRSLPGNPEQPGKAELLYKPLPPTSDDIARADSLRRSRRGRRPANEGGSFCMCYAISTGPDPFGPYFRYEFVRPLFPDYPRPAIWPDGYYIPSSTGDHIIEKHACVVERLKMLRGEPATEQCFVIKDVNFLNNADLDGFQLPPEGEPNIMLATGGSQLKNVFSDDGIYAWKFSVDWDNPENTKLEGPDKIEVAPYTYLGGGQLKESVPQPDTTRRLDAQGDKLMARVVYRKTGEQESIVAVHSVASSTGSGGIRWYEFRIDKDRTLKLFQQGTYAPDSLYRWMGSPAIDKYGNIGIGYSYSGSSAYPGQRFAGRLAKDPKGILSLKERVLVEGEESQLNTLRWMDYTQTAVDPSDDYTIWYVGDYLKKGASNYSTRIGAFQLGER